MSDLTVGEAESQRVRNQAFADAKERAAIDHQAHGYKAGLIAATEAECIWCRKGREYADGMHLLTGSAAGQWVPCHMQATRELLEKVDA